MESTRDWVTATTQDSMAEVIARDFMAALTAVLSTADTHQSQFTHRTLTPPAILTLMGDHTVNHTVVSEAVMYRLMLEDMELVTVAWEVSVATEVWAEPMAATEDTSAHLMSGAMVAWCINRYLITKPSDFPTHPSIALWTLS